ncbi:MAG: bifunctional 4-hydroxy-2-oxoglutarate aldolase/2-dehydro-3-deoxy-phosphogluconate aldolase [Clostridia bacterium]|nr:bifunctional 4-hydroxy-2-oxoglutarate aldolase/2-dehydro-3-deoxy-phosphogluconate aldolase [Clostridia bacterium]
MNRALVNILCSRIIAISRGNYGEGLRLAALALYRGGVRAFEVTFEQGGEERLTAESIAMLRSELPEDATVGAGTVLTPEQVRAAHEAGAEFIISPNTDPDVIAETKRLNMVSIPGAMTPTEIVRAHSLGADIVKVFPAGVLGVEYFKAVRAPLERIPLAAVAGITTENIASFAKAGAKAFGISSTLFNKKLIGAGDFISIENAARGCYSALDS